LTVYVTHRQLESRLRALRAGQEVILAGVRVVREPEAGGGRFRPAGGTFRVAGGEPAGLLVSMDRVMGHAGFRPRADVGYIQGDGDDHEEV
jgi:hypothetical protein